MLSMFRWGGNPTPNPRLSSDPISIESFSREFLARNRSTMCFLEIWRSSDFWIFRCLFVGWFSYFYPVVSWAWLPMIHFIFPSVQDRSGMVISPFFGGWYPEIQKSKGFPPPTIFDDFCWWNPPFPLWHWCLNHGWTLFASQCLMLKTFV